jgi:hypothetical protein
MIKEIMLNDFYLTDLEFKLRFAREVSVSPLYAGSMLRGAFGTALRRIVCLDFHQNCSDCITRESCAYQKIFSPITPVDAGRLTKNRDMPRGFIIKPPLRADTYGPERPFSFRMILVGELIQWLPYIIVPFSEIGRTGIGRQRTKFSFEKLICLDPKGVHDHEIYSATDNLVRAGEIVSPSFEKLTSMNKRKPETLTLNFLTPTLLMFNLDGRRGASRPVRVPEFHVAVKRLRDRINRLATAYCGTELQVDHKKMGIKAEEVKIYSVHGGWRERSRKTRAGERQDLSGFVGSITYEGDFEEFLPLLRLGEYLHVGKNAAFGNGWYEIAS